MTDIQPLIDRYIADDDFIVKDAAASGRTVEHYLYSLLMSALEDGTLSDDYSDLYSPEELSLLVNTLMQRFQVA